MTLINNKIRIAKPIGYVRKHGGLPPAKKSLGQNWLVDPNIAEDIANLLELGSHDLVMEVGPGEGALTGLLLETGANVIAVEIDSNMIEILDEKWSGRSNLKLIHDDILDTDWSEITNGREFSLTGNLPFHITSSLFFDTMDFARENPGKMKRLAVMVQLEVAERIAAEPGSSNYGILSVFLRFWGKPELAFKIPRTAFQPAPKVDAAIITLDIAKEPIYPLTDWKLLKRIVKGTFKMRRKMLRNSMPTISGIKPWQDLEIDWSRRPQTLSAEEFAMITEKLKPEKNRHDLQD